MEDKPHREGEIVFRITPRNLERVIYVLIIVGLLVFSFVKLKTEECPAVECDDVEETQTEDDSTTDDTTDTTTTTDTTDTTTTTQPLSGEVEFLFTDVKLCIEDEDLDKGRFESVTVYIKNGYSRTLKAKIQLYVWEGRIFDEIEDRATSIDNINLMSGAVLSTTFSVDSGKFSSKGRFIGIDNYKNVKAVLIDTELSKEIDEQIIEDVEVDSLC